MTSAGTPHRPWRYATGDAPSGGFLHWRVARLPASSRSLRAASPLGGSNDAGTTGWTGPCPPPGPAHHYRFTLRAYDRAGRLLALARLVGLYRR